MILRVLLFTGIVIASVSAFGSDTPATPSMLEVASRQAALLDNSDRPFVMDVDFAVQLNLPTQGHLRLRWEAKDRWWNRVSMGKFEQVKLQKGEWTYTLRNVDFTPKQIFDLENLLHVGAVYHKLVTRADKQRTEAGVRLDCLNAQNPDPKFKREHFDICVDSTTRDLVTETRRYDGYAADDVYREQFSDFVEFGGHRYPRKFESLKNGQPDHVCERDRAARIPARSEAPGSPSGRNRAPRMPRQVQSPRDIRTANAELRLWKSQED